MTTQGQNSFPKPTAAEIIPFKNFDILSDNSALSDHYYTSGKKSARIKNCLSNRSSALSYGIAKEWRILEKHLPESIYIRGYEQRIDLLRAVIIGASGTPYHDGLFFFDILLPSDYPNNPPKVYYHAHGYRLNPNLYENGFVCLSLTHTWKGKGVELWRSGESNILQLLVSIQGLVLNEHPYFNEPGYEGKISSEYWYKKSLAYNENVFILSCKTMLHKLRKPPKGFEGFIDQHFRQRRDHILAAVLAYSNGVFLVGQYRPNGQSSSSTNSVQVSPKFKGNSEKTYAALTNAFNGGTITEDQLAEPKRERNIWLAMGVCALCSQLLLCMIFFRVIF